MGRIFCIITAISALMILLAGGGSYWLSIAKLDNVKKVALNNAASGLANTLSIQLETLQQAVDALSHSPEIISAIESGDTNIINAEATKLQAMIPGALKVRLLPTDISEPDQSAAPHMGFGDLEMVRATLTDKQKPVIQGEGAHRHLAITSAILQNTKAIGVILVSLKTDLINQTAEKNKFDGGFAEIKQDQIILATLGNPTAKINDPQIINVNNSRWSINLWQTHESDLADISLIISIILLPILLTSLAFFKGYRLLEDYLHADQSNILKAAKDMLSGKKAGNYPIHFDAMRPIIAELAQFQRAISHETLGDPNQEGEEESDFFDESFEMDYQETASTAYGNGFDIETMIAIPKVKPNNAASESVPTSKTSVKKTRQNHEKNSDIYRSYDIRGIVGQNLNAEIVCNIGKAIASQAKQLGIQTIVVGRDGRLSSPDLAIALMQGINATGCNVIDLGLVPTPLLYFVTHHTSGRSGIMITGSHNPISYNGLKIVLNGETLANEKIQDIKKCIDAGNFSLSAPGSIEENGLFNNEYIGLITEDLHIARSMKVVVDCGNGAAGEIAPILLRTLGCEVIELYCEIDGNFPNHHPDPSKPENMADLAAIVKLHAADVGIAFDGDGDRLGIIDSTGKIIWPDRQMMLFARDVLARKPGADFIYDVKCSKHLHDQILKRGGHPIMWKSGHSLIKAKLKETGAMFAGEMSGHFCFNDRWFGFDDALYAAARMMQILSEDRRSSHEVFADFPDSINTPELNIAINESEKQDFMEQLLNLADFKDAKIINIDGLRVEFTDGWGLVRASNTTPSLVLRFEADNKEALSRIQAQFKNLLLQVSPNLSLPF